MNIALIQQTGHPLPHESLETIIQSIYKAADKGAQLVILQELHNTLYFCQTEEFNLFNLAETIPGPSTEKLSKIAKEKNIVIVASLFEKRAAGLYHNTAVVIDSDGSIAGKYRKMHIPEDPGFYEKFYFTPGDLGFKPIQTSVGKLGILVCWDQWFPEGARLMALAGAELLIYPTAIGWVPEDSQEVQQQQREAWVTIQRSHAIANGLPVAVCNRVGFEAAAVNAKHGIQFWGSSFICGPQGEILVQGSDTRAEIIHATVDLKRTEEIRRMWPFLRDRRIDSYADLGKRYLD